MAYAINQPKNITMRKISKKLSGLMLLFSGIFALSGCGSKNAAVSSGNSQTAAENQVLGASSDSSSGSNQASAVTAASESANRTLAVDADRCAGCGRCARIDPEHFSMSGRKAETVSQDNLGSQNLASAEKQCPAGAISLS